MDTVRHIFGFLDRLWVYSWLFAVIIFFFSSLLLVCAEEKIEYTTVLINVKDISTNKNIVSLPVLVKTTEIKSGMEEQSTEYISNKGVFDYKLSSGSWRIELQLLDPKNEMTTYFGQRVVYIEENEPILNRTFYLIPVGAIEGTVRYSNGALVQGAELDFKCPFEGHLSYPTKSNKFGYFKASLVPKGNCTLFASYKDEVGSSEIQVLKGELAESTIILSQSAVSFNFMNNIITFIILFFLAVLIVAFILLRKKFKKINNAFRKRRSNKNKKDNKEHSDKKTKERPVLPEPSRKIFIRKIKKEALNPEKSENIAIKEKNSEKNSVKPPEIKQEMPSLKPMNLSSVSSLSTQREKDIMHTLNERETQVVKFLFEHNNFSTQNTIRNGTGIPKTSLIRCFQSLEAKKVVSIDKIGKMKKIRFTDWFLEKE